MGVGSGRQGRHSLTLAAKDSFLFSGPDGESRIRPIHPTGK